MIGFLKGKNAIAIARMGGKASASRRPRMATADNSERITQARNARRLDEATDRL